MKTFFSLSQFVLPLELLSDAVFTKWMEVFNSVILQEVPRDTNEAVAIGERPELPWWKEKKWALAIVTRVLDRYAAPSAVVDEYKEFAKWFVSTFASAMTESMILILKLYQNGLR